MALKTLVDVNEIDGLKIADLVKSSDVPEDTFVAVNIADNYIAFRLQNGPIKEVGLNGCQVTDMLKVAKHIFSELNKQFPCEENGFTVGCIEEAINWQNKRTKDREKRMVEGRSLN